MQIKFVTSITKGSKGEHVRNLQIALTELGYFVNGIDGHCGNGCHTAIIQFQKDNKLAIDGWAGIATHNRINELLLNKQSNQSSQSIAKSKYYKKGDIHIIETTPDNIEIKILGNTLHQANVYGINGTFYDTPKPSLPNSCWAIATDNGQPIGGNSMFNNYSNIPRGTIIYYKDNAIEVRRAVSINEFSKPHIWSIGGYSVYPFFNLGEEKCPGGINYKTAHSYIAYKGNSIFLFVKPNHMIKDILPFVKEMKFDGCIVVDGGGSSQLRHPNGYYQSTRKVNNVVLLKEV